MKTGNLPGRAVLPRTSDSGSDRGLLPRAETSRTGRHRRAAPADPATPYRPPSAALERIPAARTEAREVHRPIRRPATRPSVPGAVVPRSGDVRPPGSPPAVVELGGLAELFITLGTDLLFTSVSSETYLLDGRWVGATAQSWQDRTGQWIRVGRVRGVMTMQQIRRVLRLGDVRPVVLCGAGFWESSLDAGNGGVLIWSPEAGTTAYVGASPRYRQRIYQLGVRLERIK